jgi:hypothetical protein
MSKPYTGAVVFVEGVHYPVEGDGADLSRPLRWEDGSYRDAKDGEPLHNDVHHQQDAGLDPSTRVLAAPGLAAYPVGVSVVGDDEIYHLEDDTAREHPLRWDADTQTFRAAGEEA